MPETVFGEFCKDEQLRGKEVLFPDAAQLGRALSKLSFERHLRLGWFGSRPVGASTSRNFMDELEVLAINPEEAGRYFREVMDDGTLMSAPSRGVVAWYFFDRDSPLDACACVTSDIAHRLALPDLLGKAVSFVDARPYFVLIAPAEMVDDPRRPRFTDCGQLRYLDAWRPGGRTAPWVTGCEGLDEVVAPPLAFATHAVALAFVMCHEP